MDFGDVVTASNFKRGLGSPEGVIVGDIGDVYQRIDGGTGTTFYVKESGNRTNTGWVVLASPAAIDHGSLAGLGDDDHTQYHNDSRGDARYYTQSQVDTSLATKQASDADLTAIAGLDSSTAGAIASDGAGWIKKTYAQFKTALGLVKGDVGLGNVDNTSDAGKPVSTATQTALDLKANDADVAHDTGAETWAGVKTFSSDPLIPDEVYGSGWNGILEPPTKNAVYDKLEALVGVAQMPVGSVIQVVTTETTETATTTTAIPYDDTVPQNTEGAEFMTCTITPKLSTSRLIIKYSVMGTATSGTWSVALFRDTTAGAVSAKASTAATTVTDVTGMEEVSTGATDATTLKVRCGADTATTFRFNGSSARRFGAITKSWMEIIEVRG